MPTKGDREQLIRDLMDEVEALKTELAASDGRIALLEDQLEEAYDRGHRDGYSEAADYYGRGD